MPTWEKSITDRCRFSMKSLIEKVTFQGNSILSEYYAWFNFNHSTLSKYTNLISSENKQFLHLRFQVFIFQFSIILPFNSETNKKILKIPSISLILLFQFQTLRKYLSRDVTPPFYFESIRKKNNI